MWKEKFTEKRRLYTYVLTTCMYLHTRYSKAFDKETSIHLHTHKGYTLTYSVFKAFIWKETFIHLHTHKGYTPRVPGLGQITWWIVCWQKMRGHIGKKLFGNREIVFKWTVGVWEHTDSLTQSPNRASPETNTNTQRTHFVSRLLRSPWHPLAPNCYTVANRESRYPLYNYVLGIQSLHLKRDVYTPTYS